ncbi:spore germination protein [Amphibacillus sediminis]|uniref:spore germination protein n=1 Tax=Amphibacillus sediminis TaxID=360185 RepID=UPI000835E63E|nr:spore germination protein [Amphibacillus sediminis]
MPAIVGPIQIVEVGGGVINFGDSFYLAPKSASKTAAGSGTFNTGNFVNTNSGLSATTTYDPDFQDQVLAGNA